MMQPLRNQRYNIASFPKDYIAKEIFSNGLYEQSLLMALKENFLLQIKGGTIIDVGENIGNHTVFFADMASKVISIEPNPACYYLIKANIAANSCENVTVLNKAASETIGTAELTFNYQHTGGGTIEPTDISQTNEVLEVETISLDSLLDQVDNVQCLKIDAEGHEAKIIKGATNLLTRDAPVVVFEAHNLSTLRRIAQLLQEIGYSDFYDIVQSRRFSKFRILNLFYYLFLPRSSRVVQIDFALEKGYQMVVACKR
jgi:FkbM family methyltransferase